MAIRRHFRVRGRVQGVWFRAAAADTARALGLCGWVRNLDDGSVDGVAEGDEAAVAAFTAWLREGPPRARVDQVHLTELAGDARSPDFRIAPDGVAP